VEIKKAFMVVVRLQLGLAAMCHGCNVTPGQPCSVPYQAAEKRLHYGSLLYVHTTSADSNAGSVPSVGLRASHNTGAFPARWLQLNFSLE